MPWQSLLIDLDHCMRTTQWLAHVQVAMAFVREARRALEEFDMWRMAFINWPDTPWRRSALAFLPGLVGSATGAWEHVSVLEALERETRRLDAAIESLRTDGDSLRIKMPHDIPKEHWWFWLE
jgi:hypothetical protein